ncbi:sigma 54-interacting transcriptional regulator [Desulfatirhabdium butyrativorans]|uniref:sigma 54-interacting transcriptional regulator n=1 Tax=Desulfatirhabdium butyrativorans TaxID=340467 RepID=UPI000418FD9E|nr:sigma 54-interacting transcriptional regulator [Desulfatirhabdium butyrativorans]
MNEVASALGTIGSVSTDVLLQALDELSIGAFTVDIHRKVSAMNCVAQTLMGFRENEYLGQDCREVFVGIPCMVQCIFKQESGWEAMAEDESPIVDPASHRLITRLAMPIYDTESRLAGCLTILQDQSPISDLINRVHHEERSLKMILENLDIGIFTVNRGGHITFINPRAEKMTGFRREEILGNPCSKLLDPTSHAGDFLLLQEAIGQGKTLGNPKGRMRITSGERIPIRATYMALRNEKGAIVGGLATFDDLSVIEALQNAVQDSYTFYDMIGKDAVMQQVFHLARVVATSDATVLIAGETGTGKDLLAKIIHGASRRAHRPFIKVNCAAMPDTLLESEMFGYERGAFTGADRSKPGRFQDADGGTLFLDEIGDLPLSLQAKLLRVLEDQDFYPLGSRNPVRVDVRIISATNRNLAEMVRNAQFREDLFYRLNVLRIEMPPLRRRPSDLPILIRSILKRLCAQNQKSEKSIAAKAMDILLNYGYPGNVRELENILEHAVILSEEETISPEHLPEYLKAGRTDEAPAIQQTPGDKGAGADGEELIAILRQNGWNVSKSAATMGLNRTTLWRRMKKLGIGIRRET